MTVSNSDPEAPEARLHAIAFKALISVSVISLIGYGVIYYISPLFAEDIAQIGLQTYLYIALAMGLSGACLSLIVLMPGLSGARASQALMLIFLTGLIARLIMMASTPIMENDWYRYLWDGAVLAEGMDPYRYAPDDLIPGACSEAAEEAEEAGDKARLIRLADESGDIYAGINYRCVKTIYPPLAQAAFGVSATLAPFSLMVWRACLLGIDLISFWLLLKALHLYHRPLIWSGLYWWNPVVILETFNSAHMDILLIPCLLAVLIFARLGKASYAVGALAAAVAVKIWPLLLAPALLRAQLSRPGRWLGLGLVFSGLSLILLWPQYRHALGDKDQGLVAYATSWQRHAFLFPYLMSILSHMFEDGERATRLFVASLAGLSALGFGLFGSKRSEDLPKAFMVLLLILLFLSPTGYPWYQIWIAALIPFTPVPIALTLMLTAPLYYIRFISGDTDPFYQTIIVPLAFGVPLMTWIGPAFFKLWRRQSVRRSGQR